MCKRLYGRKGQSTGEYALIFAIVLGAAIAMQTYVKRELQGRMRDGTYYMVQGSAGTSGFTLPVEAEIDDNQYEPYYYKSDYMTERISVVKDQYNQDAQGNIVQDGLSYTDENEGTIRGEKGYTEYKKAEDQDIGQ